MSNVVKTFDKAAFGYKPEAVDSYVAELTQQIRNLESERDELVSKMKILAEKVNEYRGQEDELKDTLVGAQKMANQIVNEAKTKADMMTTEAKAVSEKTVYEARKQADEIIGGIKAQTEREKAILSKMQKEVSDFKANLLSVYKVHLNAITSLPEVAEEEKPAEIPAETPADSAQEPEKAEKQPEQPAEEAAPAEEAHTEEPKTVRFYTVNSTPEAAAAYEHPAKPSFEERFGELRFGRNNK